MSYIFCKKNSDGGYYTVGQTEDSYYYLEHSEDTLHIWWRGDIFHRSQIKPIIWAQKGRYGWISREQVQNLIHRRIDLNKQQKGYAKDKPFDLAFHWDDTMPLDPATVKLMREVADG